MSPTEKNTARHPAVEWALQAGFTPTRVDCTTAVVLKILDNKCKMLPGEMAAILAIYDTVKKLPARLFDARVHEVIAVARQRSGDDIAQSIHALRVSAEVKIPKAEMKSYKVFLREGLFG